MRLNKDAARKIIGATLGIAVLEPVVARCHTRLRQTTTAWQLENYIVVRHNLLEQIQYAGFKEKIIVIIRKQTIVTVVNF